jgi:hypothetical protein
MKDQNQNRKIYIVGGGAAYANWMQGVIVPNMKDADLVVFTGGEDVTPALYNRAPHPTTYYNRTRDIEEQIEFNNALLANKPMIGICRGSQFLCVMAGGILVQNQRHPNWHPIETSDGKIIMVTSTHHQRQYPWTLPNDAYNIIGWCNLSPYSQGESEDDDLSRDPSVASESLEEVEICYYKKINALAIQSHPEMVYGRSDPACKEYIEYVQGLLNKLMNKEL